MFIKNDKGESVMPPYAYKKTIIGMADGNFDKSAAWVEGADIDWEIKRREYSSAGGAIGTNSGMVFTKKDLLYIASSLPEGGRLIFCGCNTLEPDRFINRVKEDNEMVQIGPHSFAPPDYEKD